MKMLAATQTPGLDNPSGASLQPVSLSTPLVRQSRPGVVAWRDHRVTVGGGDGVGRR